MHTLRRAGVVVLIAMIMVILHPALSVGAQEALPPHTPCLPGQPEFMFYGSVTSYLACDDGHGPYAAPGSNPDGQEQLPGSDYSLESATLYQAGLSGTAQVANTNSDGVICRNGPGTDAEYLTYFPEGAVVQEFSYISADGAWQGVVCSENLRGFVSAQYLSPVGSKGSTRQGALASVEVNNLGESVDLSGEIISGPPASGGGPTTNRITALPITGVGPELKERGKNVLFGAMIFAGATIFGFGLRGGPRRRRVLHTQSESTKERFDAR